MDAHRLHHGVTNAAQGVERRHRLLKNHGHAAGADLLPLFFRGMGHVLPVHAQGAGKGGTLRRHAHEAEREHGFA